MPESVEVNAIRARAGQWATGALTILVAAGRSAPESVLAHSRTPITPSVSQSTDTARVFAELERIRFRTLHFTEIDNMTCSLELKDKVGQHSVSWKMGQPPAQLEPVLAALNRAFGDDHPRWP